LMGMCGEFYSPREYAIILREMQQTNFGEIL
jgi:hypothetical protein